MAASVSEIMPAVKVTGNKAWRRALRNVIMCVYRRALCRAQIDMKIEDPMKGKLKPVWVLRIDAQKMCAEVIASDMRLARRHDLNVA